MSDPQTPQPDRSVKVPHLVFGLLFLGAAGLWAIGESHAISGERLTILGPAVLIAAGVIGLVASLATGSNRRRRQRALEHDDDVAYQDDTYAQPYDDTDNTTQEK